MEYFMSDFAQIHHLPIMRVNDGKRLQFALH